MSILATKVYRDGHPQLAPNGNQTPYLPLLEPPDRRHDIGQVGRVEAEPKHTHHREEPELRVRLGLQGILGDGTLRGSKALQGIPILPITNIRMRWR